MSSATSPLPATAPLQNSVHTYGRVAKTFHWLTALLILTAIPLGIVANNMPFETGEELARKALVFSIHKTVGITAFFVALGRIAWAVTQPRPAPLHPDRKAETLAAEVVHFTLYGAIVLVPLSGWIHHAATTGFAPIWWPFGQNLPFVPKSDELAETFAALHVIFERVLIISLVLHIAGALKHRFVDRDVTLARMLPGAVTIPALKPHRTGLLPPFGAVAAFLAAVGVGAALGLFSHSETRPGAPALEQVASDWTVQDGTLGFSVAQMGQPISGSFEDWTAAIAYDDTSGTGTVEVTIAIGSLALGQVTGQALGTEFFAADAHPTAIFTAEITPDDTTEGATHLATGTLALKGTEVPVTLPFTLSITDGTATMSGELVLPRLAFDIGPNYPDGSQVGLEVTVSAQLTATKAP
ncbi:cytochrome b/b6 domain-containing protein [Tropicimonas sp. S265A]|uniref:cytochrome b/b6 domain-containing protein n=1 Tax=Tropicimonas sp. S265A TaxID=3415134 RepID=UPI003C7C8F70